MRQPVQPTDGFPSMRDIGLANAQQRLAVSRDILTIETPLGREITEFVVSFLATESVNENDLLDWALTAPDSLRSFLDAVSDTDGGTLTFLRTVRVLSGVSPVITDVNDHGVLLNAVNRHRFPSHFVREIDHYVDDIVARWSDPERPEEVSPSVRVSEDDPDDESDPEMPPLEEREDFVYAVETDENVERSIFEDAGGAAAADVAVEPAPVPEDAERSVFEDAGGANATDVDYGPARWRVEDAGGHPRRFRVCRDAVSAQAPASTEREEGAPSVNRGAQATQETVDWVRLLSVTWAGLWRIYLRNRNQPREPFNLDNLPENTNFFMLGYAAPIDIIDYIEMYLETGEIDYFEINEIDYLDQEDSMEF